MLYDSGSVPKDVGKDVQELINRNLFHGDLAQPGP